MQERVGKYVGQMQAALSGLRVEEIDAALSVLRRARADGATVYTCGNGGSAATASHLAVDLARNTRGQNGSGLRVIALTDNVPWLTAVSNDGSYEDCFAEQLVNLSSPGDVLIGISASGDSENLVRVFEAARRRELTSIALVGFDGGRLSRLATQRVWVDSGDYGIVETAHLFVAHLFVETLRQESDETATNADKKPLEAWMDGVVSRPAVEIPMRVAGAPTTTTHVPY